MTSSDHIPILATITCKTIPIKIKPRLQFIKADWTGYRNSMTIIEIPKDIHQTLEQIDNHLDKWTSIVQQATESYVPKIKYRILPGIKRTDDIKFLQVQYDAANLEMTRKRPSLHISRLINDLKRQLTDSYRLLQNQTWNDLIHQLDIENHPQKFWKTIRRLKGNDKQKIPYLQDSQNQKIHSDRDKERLFRNHWQKIFSNIDDEYNDFDNDHTALIEPNLTNNLDHIQPYNNGASYRMDRDFPPTTTIEFAQTLKQFKQKAPGPSKITTLQLKNLPPNIIQYLIYIFNQSISPGYFPNSFKHARMIFIP